MKPNGVVASFQVYLQKFLLLYSKKKQFNSSTAIIKAEYEILYHTYCCKLST